MQQVRPDSPTQIISRTLNLNQVHSREVSRNLGLNSPFNRNPCNPVQINRPINLRKVANQATALQHHPRNRLGAKVAKSVDGIAHAIERRQQLAASTRLLSDGQLLQLPWQLKRLAQETH